MKKRIILMVLTLSLLVSLCPAVFAAEGERAENQCGEEIYWSYADGVLTLTGSGEMDDLYEYVPWEEYRDEITTLVLEGEITYIGAHSFTDYDALEAIDFGDSLKEIGYEAFKYCDGLTTISLPETFKVFGEECFMSCRNLKEIHCSGNFPSFRMNSMWDTYVTIYFPVDRPWGVEYIQQLEEAFQGRIEFLASDGSDPYVPEEETEEVTEEVTEETTVETTEATTEATVATTEEVTEAVTEEVTEIATETEATEAETSEETSAPETEAQETIEETEAQEEPEKKSGSWIGVAIVLGILLVVCLGALIFGGRNKGSKGGKYRAR